MRQYIARGPTIYVVLQDGGGNPYESFVATCDIWANVPDATPTPEQQKSSELRAKRLAVQLNEWERAVRSFDNEDEDEDENWEEDDEED